MGKGYNGLSFYKLHNKTTGQTTVVNKGVKGMTLTEKKHWRELGFEIVETIKMDYEFYKFLKNFKKTSWQ